MASYTIFGATEDGQIASDAATYAGARDGTGTLTGNTAGATITIGQNYDTGSDPNRFVWEGFLAWDTSSIVDSEVVTAVTLGIYGAGDNSTQDFNIQPADKNWGVALTTADWVAGADLAALTSLATAFGTAGFSISAYNSITGNASFIALISKTGVTRIMLYSSRHSGNNAPADTVPEFVSIHSSDAAGTTNDPKLDITTTSAAGYPKAVMVM